MNEQETFSELLGEDRFDDSVCGQHQHDLRAEVLQAFDQPDRELPCPSTFAEAHVRSPGDRRHASRSLRFVVIAAACLIGLVTVWVSHGTRPPNRLIVHQTTVPHVTDDSTRLAALTEVNTYREDVSREAFFQAIAMCELGHQGRVLSDSTPP